VLSTQIYAAEKMVKENAEKISDDDKKVVEEAVEEAKKSETSDDKEELEKAFTALNEKISPIGAKLYEAADEAESKDDDDKKSSKKSGDDVVEGEVVDKDKKK